MSYFTFREEWLTAGIDLCRVRIEAAGYKFPDKLKIACSFAAGSRGGKKIKGQCISPVASAGGITEMLVSPTIDDPEEAIGVALHELGHACVGVDKGHGPAFKKFCKAIGLVGKATQAMPGEELTAWIRAEVLPMLGDYPHSAVDPSQRKKQPTRMIKLVCPETGYTVRITRKWLDMGPPISPAGHHMHEVGVEDDGE
jgi:hypothetical protein